MAKRKKASRLGDLRDIPLPPNIPRPEMWTSEDIVKAIHNGHTFMIPFDLGAGLFSKNAYWIGGVQYGSTGLTVGPHHTPEIVVLEPDNWLRAKVYFPPELVPEGTWLEAPNKHGVVPVYLEVDPETIDWDILNRGYQIRGQI